MEISRRQLMQGAVAAALLAGMELPLAPPARAAVPTSPELHLLNRISFGALPEDLRRVHRLGIARFLDQQLNPRQLERDPELRRRMAPYKALDYSRQQLGRLEDSYGVSYKSLIAGMVTRAAHSPAQLLERMVEFWSDHFNATSETSPVDYVLFQREAIRRHALGRFSDLLLATAQSPAMLYYLDNFLNVAEAPNENYAREVMELHTLGVDGGYTEADVRNVARALTGWTVEHKGKGGFAFHLPSHDLDPKQVLGVNLPGGRGIEDGLDVLAILAAHPSTARHVCRKLCVRFVSDNPPVSLVDSLVAVWNSTGGEIRPVLRTLFLSPEFGASQGLKLRRGLDYAIGVMRASGTDVTEFWSLHYLLELLAQVPYAWHPPNGYPDVAPAWMNTGALLARWNTAFYLTDRAVLDPKSTRTQLLKLVGKPRTVDALVTSVSQRVFGAPLEGADRTPYVTFASDGLGGSARVTPTLLRRKAGALFGLMLASPAYQWR
jgi:hypothetical protein